MSDIPDDIMRTAGEVALSNLGHGPTASANNIARAIMAERERSQQTRFEELQAAYRRGVDFACGGAGVNGDDYIELLRYVPKAAYDYADKATSGGIMPSSASSSSEHRPSEQARDLRQPPCA